jgi:hypothetical protein
VVEKRYEYSETPEVAKTADEDFSFEIWTKQSKLNNKTCQKQVFFI